MSLQVLHQKIIEQDAAGAVKAARSLRLTRQNINPPTLYSFGMTGLQLASMYGMLNVVLELMLAGADINQVGLTGDALKSPLYLALDNGHNFLTNVLVALGANLQSVSLQANIIDDGNLGLLLGTVSVDKSLLFSLAIWSVINNNLDIFKVIYKSLMHVPTVKEYLRGLYELAAYSGLKDFTLHISTLVKPRHDIAIRTPAYWIIVNDSKNGLVSSQHTYAYLTPTVKDWIVTLQQLQLDNTELFYKIFEKLDSVTKKAFLDDKNIIYQVKNFAYNAAAKADKKMLEMLSYELSFNQLITEAQRTGNLVAFMTLDHINKKPNISSMLEARHIYSLTHYFIHKNPDLYDAALTFSATGQLLPFLELFWSIEGARKALIRRAIKYSSKLTEPMQKMIAQLMQHDRRKFADDVVQLIGQLSGINLQRVEHVPTATTYELVLHDVLDPKVFSNIKVRFNRLNISIRHAFMQSKTDKLQNLPAGVWTLVVGFLGKVDRQTVFFLSAGIHNMMLSAKPMEPTALTREKIRELEFVIKNYKFVLALMIRDTNKQMHTCGGATLLVGLGLAACLAIMFYYTFQLDRAASEKEYEFFHTIVPDSNSTCSDVAKYKDSVYASCNTDMIYEFCKRLCRKFQSDSDSEAGLFVGDFFTGLIVLLILSCAVSIIYSPKDNRAESTFLSKKSLAQIEKAEIKDDLRKDFGTEYDERMLKDSIHKKALKLQQLKALLPPEEKAVVIEVIEEKDVEEKKAPSSNNHPFWQQPAHSLALSLDNDEVDVFDPMHPLLG